MLFFAVLFLIGATNAKRSKIHCKKLHVVVFLQYLCVFNFQTKKNTINGKDTCCHTNNGSTK